MVVAIVVRDLLIIPEGWSTLCVGEYFRLLESQAMKLTNVAFYT